MTTPKPDGALNCVPCAGTGKVNLQPNGDADTCKNCDGNGWFRDMQEDILPRGLGDRLSEDLERFRRRYRNEQGATVRKIKVDALMYGYGLTSRPRLAVHLASQIAHTARALAPGDEFQDLAFVIERELAMVAFRTERFFVAALDKRGVEPPIIGMDEFDQLPVERLTMAQFEALPEYSTTLPTGTTIGKRWKAKRSFGWLMGEYIEIGRLDRVGIKWTRVQVETSS